MTSLLGFAMLNLRTRRLGGLVRVCERPAHLADAKLGRRPLTRLYQRAAAAITRLSAY